MPDTATLPTAAELRDRCTELAADLVGRRNTPESRRGDSTQWAADTRSVLEELTETDRIAQIAEGNEARALAELAFHDAEQRRQLEELAFLAGTRAGNGPTAAFGGADQGEARSAGEQFTDSEFYAERRMVGEQGEGVEVRNLLTGTSLGTSGSHAFVPVGSPFWVSQAARRMNFFLRDLIPASQTNLTAVPYIRELNAAANEGGASAVQEASAKPEVTMEFEQDTANIRKIAAWIQITEEAYTDAPTLRGYIDTRLAYMLQVREEALMINGNGTAPNLKGILQFTGVQTQAAVTDDLAGTIGLAIGKVENVDGMANGVAINPITFWTGVVERHSSQMDGQGLGPLPFATTPSQQFGLPVVRTRALAANSAIVADWNGAQIFDRLGTTIKTSDSHASLFISNTLVVLAEKRVGLAVHRPDWFVNTTLAFT